MGPGLGPSGDDASRLLDLRKGMQCHTMRAAHPAINSSKFKRAVCWAVAYGLRQYVRQIFALSIGTSRRRNAKRDCCVCFATRSCAFQTLLLSMTLGIAGPGTPFHKMPRSEKPSSLGSKKTTD